MILKQIALCLILFFLTFPALLHADIATDGTVGAAQTLTGPDYAIPETLGTLKGDNLFHSFDKFSIKKDESATFTGSDSIKNVISRVTGGEKSEIDGTLRSNVGKADFYFINPSGVVFGQNAKVDVPAAFHVSTADELKFADGASFKASKSEQSTLTQAAPESFGFLDTQSASIEINGSTLEFKPESKVSLTSSKDITIKGTNIGTEEKQAVLKSAGGEIELKANGDLLMDDNAGVDTSGNGGGKIKVKSSNLKLKNKSYIFADNTGDKNSVGGVEIEVDKQIDLINSSRITSDVLSKGNAGNIAIKSGNMRIDGRVDNVASAVGSAVSPNSEGKAGTVEITVDELLEVLNGGVIRSSTFSKGDAGNVKINTKNMKIDRQGSSYVTGIASNAGTNSEGKAGTVEITVAEYLELINGGSIGSSTFSKGDSGSVKINAKSMKIDRQGSSYFTGVASSAEETNSEGKAGTVSITITELLEVLNGGAISSSTWSKGDAGYVKINAGNMKIDGQGSSYGTGIASNASPNSEGKAGTVEITISEYLELLNGCSISSSTFSKGDAGNVIINAKNLKIDRQGSSYVTGIVSDAGTNSEGKAGTVEITISEYLELLNGGSIGSATFSQGDAGYVKINAKNMKIDRQGSSYFTGVASSADANSLGNADEVEITITELLEVLNGGEIGSSTFSKGDAGNVKINANNMKIDGQGSSYLTGITSDASPNSEGKAGTVEITVAEYLELINGGQISSSTFSKGDAGNVIINAGNIKFDGQGELSAITGVTSVADLESEGKAGTIKITSTGLLELLNGGVIASNTCSKGNAGDVIINADKLFSDSSYIQSASGDTASGYVGNVKINADSVNLINGSNISIGAYQTLSEEKLANMPHKSITLNTKQLNIEGESQIISESTKNVPASNININSDSIYLHDGLITTSVYGTNGDGGNISINEDADSNPAGFLVMQNGFIQANTLAEGSKGGKIRINPDTLLIADKSMPFQIGGEPEAFSLDDKKNIIQAADPSKKTQDIEAPEVPIDLSGQIINTGSKFSEPVKMAENYCRLIGTKRASHLTLGGRGGIPEDIHKPASISFGGERLDELLEYEEK